MNDSLLPLPLSITWVDSAAFGLANGVVAVVIGNSDVCGGNLNSLTYSSVSSYAPINLCHCTQKSNALSHCIEKVI